MDNKRNEILPGRILTDSCCSNLAFLNLSAQDKLQSVVKFLSFKKLRNLNFLSFEIYSSVCWNLKALMVVMS